MPKTRKIKKPPPSRRGWGIDGRACDRPPGWILTSLFQRVLPLSPDKRPRRLHHQSFSFRNRRAFSLSPPASYVERLRGTERADSGARPNNCRHSSRGGAHLLRVSDGLSGLVEALDELLRLPSPPSQSSPQREQVELSECRHALSLLLRLSRNVHLDTPFRNKYLRDCRRRLLDRQGMGRKHRLSF